MTAAQQVHDALDRKRAAEKSFETARAECGLVGIVLARTDDDRGRAVYIASRGPLCKQFDSLDAVRAWLRTGDE
jgi:hypothetical protein